MKAQGVVAFLFALILAASLIFTSYRLHPPNEHGDSFTSGCYHILLFEDGSVRADEFNCPGRDQ